MACCADKCVNRPCRNSTLQFFRLPHRDPERLKMWLLNIKRKDWTPSTSSRLCSEHFEEDQFLVNNQGLKRLKSTAVPTIFNLPIRKKMEVSACPFTAVVVKEEESDEPVFPSLAHFGHGGNFTRQDHSYVNEPIEVIVKEESSDSAEQDEGVTANCNAIESIRCLDHNYIIADSPLLLKRKMVALQGQLHAARKKLKLKYQHTRRLKKQVSSLKNAVSVLQKKLLVFNKFAALLPAVDLEDCYGPDPCLSLGD